MRRKPRQYTRDERAVMIITAFASKLTAHGAVWMTCAEVAAQIGLVRSSHLDNILLDMVVDKRLDVRVVQRPGRWPGREYMLADGTYTLPKKRNVDLKKNGVLVGQMELWP